MKTNNKSNIIIALAAVSIGLVIGFLLRPSTEQAENHSASQHQHKGDEVWTCSMHPNVRQSEPGKCPICGMELIPAESGAEQSDPLEIIMSPTALKLANVQTSVIGMNSIEKAIQLTGKVQPDEQHVFSQTSHISGRIEELLVNVTGSRIRKGEKIATIYSPDLVTAQKELFEAIRIKDSQPRLYEAARQKLKNWKLSDAEIDRIIEQGQPSVNFPILSDNNGVIMFREVNPGSHIEPGAVIYQIADLSRLWIQFDIYERELSRIKVGTEVEYTVASLPGRKLTGRIDFIDPVIDPLTRVAKARISVTNSDGALKPEMFVSGTIKGSNKLAQNDVIVPKSAVLWTGKRSIAYVMTKNEQHVGFVMRELLLGQEIGDGYVVEDGLQAGEVVATNGTFSIDAAAQLAGKPSMMSPPDVMDEESYHKGTSTKAKNGQQSNFEVSDQIKEILDPVYEAYLSLKDALVEDSYEKARVQVNLLDKAISDVQMSANEDEVRDVWEQYRLELMKYSKVMLTANTLEGIRTPFKPLSTQLIGLTHTIRANRQKLFVQHCPMADDFNGADWLSLDDNILNPYYGASMLTCGEVTDSIAVASKE